MRKYAYIQIATVTINDLLDMNKINSIPVTCDCSRIGCLSGSYGIQREINWRRTSGSKTLWTNDRGSNSYFICEVCLELLKAERLNYLASEEHWQIIEVPINPVVQSKKRGRPFKIKPTETVEI